MKFTSVVALVATCLMRHSAGHNMYSGNEVEAWSTLFDILGKDVRPDSIVDLDLCRGTRLDPCKCAANNDQFLCTGEQGQLRTITQVSFHNNGFETDDLLFPASAIEAFLQAVDTVQVIKITGDTDGLGDATQDCVDVPSCETITCDFSPRVLCPFAAPTPSPSADTGESDLGTATSVIKFQAGAHHNCAILSLNPSGEKRVKCFGSGGSWLGIGRIQNQGDHDEEMGDKLPFLNLGENVQPTDISLGRRHSCVLYSDVMVKCWGRATHGATSNRKNLGQVLSQMGDKLPPVDILYDPGEKILQIASGGYHNCILFSSGRFKCFGFNKFGQLGYGDSVDRGKSAPTMGDKLDYVDIGTNSAGDAIRVQQLALGFHHTCVLTISGEVKCFGYNKWQNLGLEHQNNIGTQFDHMGDNLRSVHRLENVVHITAGKHHTCAMSVSKAVRCWGFNGSGELGRPTLRRHDSVGDPGTVDLPLLVREEPMVLLDAGYYHTCAVFSNRRVACWGANKHGQLGVGHSKSVGLEQEELGAYLRFVKLPPGRHVVAIACGEHHSCATLDNLKPYCWGRNHQGQLGLGDKKSRGDDPGELPPGRQFRIDTLYTQTDISPALSQAFEGAVSKWSALLTTDHVDVEVGPEPLDLVEYCDDEVDGLVLPVSFVIDDFVLVVNTQYVDGSGGFQGYASNCLFMPEPAGSRATAYPRVGLVVIDAADIAPLAAKGMLDAYLVHQIGHALGFGTLWFFEETEPFSLVYNLVDGPDTDDPRYNGPGGISGLAALKGSGKPKVEGDGFADVANIHWDEEFFGNEIMTPFLSENGESMPLSVLTARSMIDLGHTINEQAVDQYTIPASGLGSRRLESARLELTHDTRRKPIQYRQASFSKEFVPVTTSSP